MTGNNNYSHSLPSFSKKSLALLSYQLHPTPHHMLRPLPFLLLAVLSCSFFSCKKDPPVLPTIVKGTVVDSKTGEPVPNAYVEFWVYLPQWGNPGYQQTTEGATTKNDGSFEYTLRSDATDISPYKVSCTGYVNKNINYSDYSIKLGETNQLTIPLIRFDAAIRLHVINEMETDGGAYLVIANPTRLAEARTPMGASTLSLIIAPGEQQNYIYPTVANEFTKFYWGGSSFFPFETAPFSDSLYFNIGDTLDYTIHF